MLLRAALTDVVRGSVLFCLGGGGLGWRIPGRPQREGTEIPGLP